MLLSGQWSVLMRVEFAFKALVLLTLPDAFLLTKGSQLMNQVIDLLLLRLYLDTVIRFHIVKLIQEVL